MRSIRLLAVLLALTGCLPGETTSSEPFSNPLARVKRIYIDKLGGDQTAAQIRDMIINALQSASIFVITENQDKADAFLRGSAEDDVFTDTFQTSEGVNARASVSGALGTSEQQRAARIGWHRDRIGRMEKIAERKHEAFAAVRLVDASGDVIWSTTQESLGAKFRGASADVADKVVKQLIGDLQRARRPITPPPANPPADPDLFVRRYLTA